MILTESCSKILNHCRILVAMATQIRILVSMATKIKKNAFKIFWSETTGPLSMQFGGNIPLVTLYQGRSSHHDLSKPCRHGAGLILPYVTVKKTSGPVSIQIGRNVPLVAVYQDCSSCLDLSKKKKKKKTWPPGRGWGMGGGGTLDFPLYIYI